MDGKTVRNTCLPGTEGTEIKLFSALTHTDAVVIAQVGIPQDTNEITQVTALLAGVDSGWGRRDRRRRARPARHCSLPGW